MLCWKHSKCSWNLGNGLFRGGASDRPSVERHGETAWVTVMTAFKLSCPKASRDISSLLLSGQFGKVGRATGVRWGWGAYVEGNTQNCHTPTVNRNSTGLDFLGKYGGSLLLLCFIVKQPRNTSLCWEPSRATALWQLPYVKTALCVCSFPDLFALPQTFNFPHKNQWILQNYGIKFIRKCNGLTWRNPGWVGGQNCSTPGSAPLGGSVLPSASLSSSVVFIFTTACSSKTQYFEGRKQGCR